MLESGAYRQWMPPAFQASSGVFLYNFPPQIAGSKTVAATVGFCMAPTHFWTQGWNPEQDLEDSDWVKPEQEITRILVESFQTVTEVESICAQFGPEEITVWTLLRSYDRKARSKVHDKELEICNSLNVYDFDFRVTSIELVSPDELCRGGLRELYKRERQKTRPPLRS